MYTLNQIEKTRPRAFLQYSIRGLEIHPNNGLVQSSGTILMILYTARLYYYLHYKMRSIYT